MVPSVLGLLIGLRAEGIVDVKHDSVLHRALKRLLAEGVSVEGSPVQHPLFGYYAAVDEAIDEACRSGILDHVFPRGGYLFRIDQVAARRLVDHWGVDSTLTARFAAHCRCAVQGS